MNRNLIMIIDDDAEALEMMIRQLESLYDAEGYSSGEEALEALKTARGGGSRILFFLTYQ